jgi:radical SAM superfamily enzyme YgiQ (UPF0313 family)
MYLDSFLEKNNIKSRIIELKTKSFSPLSEQEIVNSEDKIIDIISREKPLIVGMSCFTDEVEYVHRLAKKIKDKGFSGKIVVGGVHPTLFPKDLINSSDVDIAIIGEGEKTFAELATALKEEKHWKNIDGIAFMEESTIKVTKTRELIENLDDIPFPSFEKVDMEYYTTPHVYGVRWLLLSTFYIFTTRGCPSACKFCINHNLWKTTGKGKSVRFRDVKKVVDELEILKRKYKIDSFYIYDDNFIIDKKRTFEFCDELKKRGLGLIWACEARVNIITDELVKAMKDAGCIQIDFGVESGSQRSLDVVNKNITVEQIKKAFRICKKYKIRTFANMMFNFPGETEKDIEETYKLLNEIRPTYSSFAIMTPYPGTDIFQDFNICLPISEYKLYRSAAWMLDGKKFRMSNHNLDLEKLVTDATTKYNSVLRNLDLRLIWTLLKTFIKSKRKKDYIKSVYLSGKYLILKRFPKRLKGNLRRK